MKPEQTHKYFGIANKYTVIGIVVFIGLGMSAWGLGSMITADNSNLGDVLTISYSGTDTATVQSYFNTAGISEIILNGDMTIDTITVPSNIRKISGTATIRQKTVPGNGFEITNMCCITVEGLTFVGQGGNFSQSQNSGIQVKNATNVRILNNNFTFQRLHAVHFINVSVGEITGNQLYNVSHGIRLTKVNDIIVSNNVLDRSQYNNFSVAIGVDESGNIPMGNNTNITITNNIINNYKNSQAILAHDLKNGLIADNQMYNSLIGVTLGWFASGDRIEDIVVSNNVWNGTTDTLPINSIGNQCINVGGDTTYKPFNIIISGNKCSYAADRVKTEAVGAIGIAYINDTLISGNIITNEYSTGIAITGNNYNVGILGNFIGRPSFEDANSFGVYIISGITNNTVISGNSIYDHKFGVRTDVNAVTVNATFNNVFNASFTTFGTLGNTSYNVP